MIVKDPRVALRSGHRLGINGLYYPEDGDNFAEITSFTPASLYLFSVASGNVPDVVGSAHLPTEGAATYGYTMPDGRRGIRYDASGDGHDANVHALGTATSAVFFAVFDPIADLGGSNVIVGRSTSSADPCVLLYLPTTITRPRILIRDAAAGQVLVNFTDGPNLYTEAGPFLGSLQIDRTADVVRARVSRRGQLIEQVSSSIAAVGDLDGGTQEFGFGNIPGGLGDIAHSYGGVFTGAQAEGATVLASLHRSLGWE